MPHFECGAIDHSATSPGAYLEHLAEKWNPPAAEKSTQQDGRKEWERRRACRRHAALDPRGGRLAPQAGVAAFAPRRGVAPAPHGRRRIYGSVYAWPAPP